MREKRQLEVRQDEVNGVVAETPARQAQLTTRREWTKHRVREPAADEEVGASLGLAAHEPPLPFRLDLLLDIRRRRTNRDVWTRALRSYRGRSKQARG